MKASKLRNITAVLAKVMEIILWVAVVFVTIGAIAIFALRDKVSEEYFETNSFTATNFNGLDFELNASNFAPAMVGILVSAAILAVLMAFMFRYVNQIFNKTNTSSPFADANVVLVKRIGYIAIAIPVVKLIANIILGFIADNLSLGFEFSEVLFGLIVLCLSQYFAYGATLEKDVDGLL
ncbi:Protein of unknown function [Pseudobutyrivibrio sp. YE44]|uniref:DUF2975 domain-containing protein n=1 Tax=Pseudobutyrivibrio sp. YE44 TaxID=1520802 RepID=UPI00088DAFC5|nr:DUF2975 domain-containing protein [Pseudobutyrivibrio sp. YE44]SDB40471.1 Protein of unknown function [Pseudobutyrivibrio sp. YE44]